MSEVIGTVIGILMPLALLCLVFISGVRAVIKIVKKICEVGENGTTQTKQALSYACKEDMPNELAQGTLYISESDISTGSPRPMHGRVDQVYDYRGTLIPVDTKVRQRNTVYPSDVAQLSIYKVILENSLNRTVSRYGFIRLVCYRYGGRSVIYKKVKLFPESKIIALWEYYQLNR